MLNFSPFDSHYEVHCRCVVSSLGNEFYSSPKAIMSSDLHSTIVDVDSTGFVVPGKSSHSSFVIALYDICVEEIKYYSIV